MSCSACKGNFKIKCSCDHGFILLQKSSSVGVGMDLMGGGKVSSSDSMVRSICPICSGTEWKICGKCDGKPIPIVEGTSIEKSQSSTEQILLCPKQNRTKHILKKRLIPAICNKCYGVANYNCPKCFDCDFCSNCALKE